MKKKIYLKPEMEVKPGSMRMMLLAGSVKVKNLDGFDDDYVEDGSWLDAD